jgi:hypothetical protein
MRDEADPWSAGGRKAPIVSQCSVEPPANKRAPFLSKSSLGDRSVVGSEVQASKMSEDHID